MKNAEVTLESKMAPASNARTTRQSRPSTISGAVTGWNPTTREVDLDSGHKLVLDHPFRPKIEWRLIPGAWLVGAIIVVIWQPEERSTGELRAYPPYRAASPNTTTTAAT
jgi:hypothetical protein